MKVDLKEINNRIVCNSKAYSLRIVLLPETEPEAMKLGILSQALRTVDVRCMIHPETGRLEIRATRATGKSNE